MHLAPSSLAGPVAPAGPDPSPATPRGAAAPLRAFAAAAGVAALVGTLFPYVILKLGFGPNASVVSTLAAGALLGGRATRSCDRVGLHLAQAAGVAAAQSAFGCVALAAFELWRRRAGHAVPPLPGGLPLVIWLAASGCLGVLVASNLRTKYLADEALPFAGGVVGAEAIFVFESGSGSPKGGARALAKAAAASAALALLPASRLGALGGVALGSGMMLGPRVALSLGAGSVVAEGPLRGPALWAAVGLVLGSSMARAGLAAASTFGRASKAERRGAHAPGGDLPRRVRWLGTLAVLAVFCVSGHDAWGVPVWLTLAGAALSLPLLLVGARVLGETSWAPATTLTAAAQALIGAVVPGCASAMMVVGSAAGGAIPTCGAHLLQSLRTAQLVGARPRETALAQLLGTAVGAAALGLTFPLLAQRYDFGSGGAAPPLGLRLAELAESLARGPSGLPSGARWALAAAAVAGAALALSERRFGRYLPSAAALGVGLLLPPSAALPAVAGALGMAAWVRARPGASRALGAPVAAGLVAGEALVALALALWA